MQTKEIIVAVAEAINRNDGEAIVRHFSENIEWNMLADKVYSGLENIKQMFSPNAEMKIINCTMDHILAEGDTGVIDGYVECMGKNGEIMKMYYCDIYELENGKVKKMISYTVDKKK